jgi:hypothetical protein
MAGGISFLKEFSRHIVGPTVLRELLTAWILFQ